MMADGGLARSPASSIACTRHVACQSFDARLPLFGGLHPAGALWATKSQSHDRGEIRCRRS